MKKSILMIFVIVLIGIMLGSTVLAAEPTITLNGNAEEKAGEKGEITVRVNSQDTVVGVVSGKIRATANLDEIKCTPKNGWNITYNDTTGEFNIYKAEGTKDEEIFTIEYYVKDNAKGTATITLSNLEVTTMDYETKEIADLKKDITITSKTEQGTENDTDKVENNVGNVENNVIIDNSIKLDNVVVDNSTNQNKIDIKNNNTSTKDNTMSNNIIPRTGAKAIILPVICLGIVVLAIATYIGYRKYRDIR